MSLPLLDVAGEALAAARLQHALDALDECSCVEPRTVDEAGSGKRPRRSIAGTR